jgi:hypothetical protein
MKTTRSIISRANERELAAGVLKQAAEDLRRFRGATIPVERELFRDARSWVMSDDCSWPFSFVNVCRLVNHEPNDLREQLLADLAFGVFGQWTRRGSRALRRFSDSLTGRLMEHREDAADVPASLTQISY